MTKNLLKAAMLCLMPLAAAAQTDADTEQPIITLHSSAYTEVGESNQFSFLIGATENTYLDIDLGAGKNEVEVEVASIDTSTGEFKGTWIPARADANGVIKIYGDASKIDVLVMDGAYITDIDFAQCTNLEILSLEHNVLRALDLTPFSKLAAIYLTDNPFTEQTPLVIGTPKPNLQILEMDIIDHIDPAFNLSDYPNLVTFDGYHSLGITKIDPTGCPNLRSLSLEMTAVESVDVSKNANLTSLNVSESRVRELDLSNNPNLLYLLADHTSGTINTDVKFTHIDVSNNPNLFFFSAACNNLTNIDLSKNTYLQNLSLRGNHLTALDLSKNVNLYSIDVMLNDMDYATLPLPDSNWGEYFYNQNSMPVVRSLGVDAELDMSTRVLRDGTETSAKVMRKPFTGDAVELDESYYTYADGKITFSKAVSDSVYVQFSNNVFSEYTIQTTPFRVKDPAEVGQPTKMIALNLDYSVKELKINVGIAGASASEPRKLLVDFGGSERTELTTCSATIDELSEVTLPIPASFSGRINLWMPEGNDLSAFAIDGTTIYDIDIKAATALQELSVTNASLYSIDLRYNRCLTYLDLSGNELTSLSLLGIYGDYEKNVLHTLKAANNRLATLDLRDGSPIHVLDLSHNKFTEIPTTEFDNATDFNISHNEIAGQLSLTYQLNAERIDVSNNPLTSLLLDKFTALQYFNVSNTGLTFETLPLTADIPGNYVYAPLNDITLQDKAPAVNLSAQNRVINGTGTTFVWKKADGTVLVQGVDIDCVDGGTRFLKDDLGAVYCQMTNPAFPGLTLTTSKVTVAGAPTTVAATLTGTSGTSGELILRGSKTSALYIDWRGDGTEYVEYPFSDSDISNYEIHPVAGATAKIYTYGDPAELTVFSIYGVGMTGVDVTPLTGLTALSIGDAGLGADALALPDANLTELNLSNNRLTSFPFAAKYPNLYMVTLSGNSMTEFDASVLPAVGCLYLADNRLTSVKFNNPELWDLHLSGNKLETVDLNGLPSLQQLFLNNNLLATIDLAPVKSSLRALNIVGNRFTFATLPRAEEAPLMITMFYGLQAPMAAECIDGRVDLSSQAVIDGVETVYTWYLGDATLDVDNGVYVGETLIENDEYYITDGVTSFATTFNEKIMCVMSNPLYPNLLLTTERIDVDRAGLNEVETTAPAATANSGCYDLLGRKVTNPKAGIYVINGRKVMIR